MSSLEIDLSVTSAGTGGRVPLSRLGWDTDGNPSGRRGLNYPLKRVKAESNYTQLAAGGLFRR